MAQGYGVATDVKTMSGWECGWGCARGEKVQQVIGDAAGWSHRTMWGVRGPAGRVVFRARTYLRLRHSGSVSGGRRRCQWRRATAGQRRTTFGERHGAAYAFGGARRQTAVARHDEHATTTRIARRNKTRRRRPRRTPRARPVARPPLNPVEAKAVPRPAAACTTPRASHATPCPHTWRMLALHRGSPSYLNCSRPRVHSVIRVARVFVSHKTLYVNTWGVCTLCIYNVYHIIILPFIITHFDMPKKTAKIPPVKYSIIDMLVQNVCVYYIRI